MKKTLVMMFCLGLAAPLFADGTNQFADEKSKASYAYGLLNGTGWRTQDVGFDPDIYMRGLKDGLSGGPTQMTEAEAKDTMTAFQKEFRARMMAKTKAVGETNKVLGEAFLTKNKMAPGIKLLTVTLPNGQCSEMQYLVISNGSGPMPALTDRVSVNYRGTLLDGTEFDSSYKRNQPATFPVTGVIKGWTEALKHMPVGSKWKLFIPSDLAYGEGGRPGIPPNSMLTFEIELLAIEPPAAPPAPAAPLTSDIIKVPGADELKKGAKIEVIKPEDVQKMQQQQMQQQQTNQQK